MIRPLKCGLMQSWTTVMATSKARIVSGVWVRNVPWSRNGVWRTDIFKSVLADSRLVVAEFRLAQGPTVRISKAELQRVLVGGADHYDAKQIWGPFNINPTLSTVNDQRVEMQVV